MARIDDLTILLTLKDKTKQGFDSASKRMKGLEGRAQKLTVALKATGTALSAGFVLAARNGQMLTQELGSMARQTNLTLQESQALFNAVREADASTNLDNLNEAILSVKERFADARIAGAGPLFGLMQDFEGFNLDLGTDNARDQLADFLEQVGQLPDANAKIFALKEVIGDEDARPFFNIINNTEKLNGLLVDLRTNINSIPDIFDETDEQRLKQQRESTNDLRKEWDKLSISFFTFVAPALELINRLLTGIVRGARFAVDKLRDLQNGIAKIFGKGIADDPVELTDDAAKRLSEIKQAETSALAERDRALREIDSAVTSGQAANDDSVDRLGPENEAQRLRDDAFFFRHNLEQESPGETDFLNSLDKDSFAGRFNVNEEDFETFEEIMRKVEETARTRAENTRTALLSVGNAFGEMAQLASGKSESAFKVFKSVQIALSTVAAFSAATQSLAEAKGDPFLRLAAYAQILSVGLGAVSAIRGVNIGSGGASSGGGASVSTPQVGAIGGTAQQSQADSTRGNKTTIVLEGRDKTYDSDDIENIVEGLKIAGLDVELLAA